MAGLVETGVVASDGRLPRMTGAAVRLAAAMALGVAAPGSAGVTVVNAEAPVIEGEIDQAVKRGVAHVLVEVALPSTPATDAGRRSAIAAAQERVLSRLPPGHFSLVRRYETVPMLALEIDADALRALERMGDAVTRILPDRTVPPAGAR
jgi:hypothetical protein